jgi:hypothetical protein
VLSWPFSLAAPIGIDQSWHAALHLIGPLGLRFGEDIVFTHGPLGFLSIPAPFYGFSSVVATLASGAVYFATAGTLLVLARRLLPLWASALVVLGVARLFPFLPPWETFQALVFVWCVEAVVGDRLGGRLRPDWLAVSGGVLAAVGVAGKLNVGVFAAAMLVVAAVAISRPWWRGAIILVASAGLAFLVIWLATGQSLAALPAFVVGSIEIVRGYSEAMVVDTHPTLRWVYPAYLIIVGLIGWIAWLALRERSRRELLAVGAIGAILAFAEWKTAFTRNYTYFAMVTALIALFPFASRLPGPDRRTIAAFAVALAFLASIATSRVDPIDLVDVRDSVRSVARTAAAVLPWRQAEAVEQTRAEIREQSAIPPELLMELEGQTVHVDPWQTIVVAGYAAIRWSPLPVIQSYSAYTTALDQANAERLSGADGPARILRERVDAADGVPLAVDRRFVWFESPATTLEMLCRFEELAATDRWQVLGRTDRACGPAESLGTVTARAGETVAVPAAPGPDRFLIARVTGFPDGPLDRLQALLLRSDEWYVELADRGRFRLVPGTADDGLLLAVPGDVKFHPRFAFGEPITSLVVSAGRYGERSRAPLTFEFLSVPVRGGTAGG